MHKYGMCFLLLSMCVGAQAASPKRVFEQALPYVRQELKQAPSNLPADLQQPDWPVVLSSGGSGALAEYQARKNQIVFFKRPLAAWLKQAQTQFAAEQLPVQLARCLTPIYVHELSHARDRQGAVVRHFVWPVTLEDEFIASFWQRVWMEEQTKKDPDYYAFCTPLLPPAPYRAVAPCDAQQIIYQTYARQAGVRLPPPLTRENIQTWLQEEKLTFAGITFAVKKRRLTAQALMRNGGNWLNLAPAELNKLLILPFFRLFERSRLSRAQEQQNFCSKNF